MTREGWLMTITLPIFILFIIAEIIISGKQRQQKYQVKDTWISIWFAILGGIFDIAMRGVCFLVLDFFNKHAIIETDFLIYNPLLGWILVFVAQDFYFYWLHRSEHSIRVLWAVHSNHHSSELYNFAIALRSSVFQPFYRYLFYIPIAFLGFDGATIMFVYAINQVYQFFLHTEYGGKMKTWGKIFVTPSHHRVHHASNPRYLDKNMGQVLIIWDKLFGTFQEELDEDKPVYGLTKNIETFHPIHAVTTEFERLYADIKKSSNWKDRINYLINKPDWHPPFNTKQQ